MVGYLLNIVYLVIMAAASPWLIYSAIRKGKYRQGFGEKFLGQAPQRHGHATCVWLHAVSVGEVKLLVPLVRELRAARPDWECVISTTTRTGHSLAAMQFPNNVSFYCPLDFTWAVKRAMRRVRPDMLILSELELWPNLIRLARRQGAQVAVVNGRMSDKSFPGYRRVRPLIRWLLGHIRLIACQNEQYAARFRELGAASAAVCVTGSIKFDDTQTDRDNAASKTLREVAHIADEDTVFLAGSTHAGEEEAALETYVKLRRQHPQLRLIVVPRHPERFGEVGRLLDASGVNWQRRSQLKDSAATDGESDKNSPRVLLVDTVGELSSWWGVTDIALAGGSLIPHGGQNMIEPAAFGAAICVGPHTQNFRDVVNTLRAKEAVVVVNDEQELAAFVERCLTEPQYASMLGERAAAVVSAAQGATKRTVTRLLDMEAASANTNLQTAQYDATNPASERNAA